MKSTERRYGVDLLRLAAMGMILMHHLLTHGGLMTAFPALSPSGMAAQLLNIASYCAVNVYALISGYVMAGKRFRPARLMELWLQVMFTSLVITVGFALTGKADAGDWLKVFFPVSTEAYWYFTAYFALYLFIPVIHRALDGLDKRTFQLTMLAAVMLFTLIPTLTMGDPFKLQSGYHVLWLMVLYALGQYLRRFGFGWIGRHGFAVYAACLALTWLSRIGADWLMTNGQELYPMELLVRYTSPTMLASSVALLALFDRMTFPGWMAKLLSLLSPFAFGIYLIHDHPLVRKHFIVMRFAPLANLPALQMALSLAGWWAAIFAACLAAEALRSILFRMLKVRTLTGEAERRLRLLLDKKG